MSLVALTSYHYLIDNCNRVKYSDINNPKITYKMKVTLLKVQKNMVMEVFGWANTLPDCKVVLDVDDQAMLWLKKVYVKVHSSLADSITVLFDIENGLNYKLMTELLKTNPFSVDSRVLIAYERAFLILLNATTRKLEEDCCL